MNRELIKVDGYLKGLNFRPFIPLNRDSFCWRNVEVNLVVTYSENTSWSIEWIQKPGVHLRNGYGFEEMKGVIDEIVK